MAMPLRYVLEGTHKDSGRKMNIVIRNDPELAPNRLLKIVQHMPAVQQCSLAAFAECFAASGPACAQAMGKILGDPDFLTKHNIVPGARTVLKFDHLLEQYPDEHAPIEFDIMHKRELDERMSNSDAVHFVAVDGAPYFIGDFNRARPTGVLELAATVILRDIIWIDEEFVMTGPKYFWNYQYLDEIRISHESRSRARATLQRILYDQPWQNICDDEADLSLPDQQLEEQFHRTTLGDLVHYRCGGRYVDMQALEVASRPTDEVYIVGPGRHVARRGMGAVFDFPIWLRSAINSSVIPSSTPFLDRVYGCIIGFTKSADPQNSVNITIAVHLDKDNIPSWLLSRVNDAHLLQTNREMTISERFITGVFSIWPPSLYQGMCAPGHNSDVHVNDRVVIGHLDICMRDMGPDSEASRLSSSAGDADASGRDSDSGSITSNFGYREEGGGPLRLYPHVRDMIDFLVAMHDSRAIVKVSAVNPLRASCALQCLHDQDMLFNQVAFSYADCLPGHFRPSLRKVLVAGPRDSLPQASLSRLRGILQGQSDESNEESQQSVHLSPPDSRQSCHGYTCISSSWQCERHICGEHDHDGGNRKALFFGLDFGRVRFGDGFP
jgi:hypothetical protein